MIGFFNSNLKLNFSSLKYIIRHYYKKKAKTWWWDILTDITTTCSSCHSLEKWEITEAALTAACWYITLEQTVTPRKVNYCKIHLCTSTLRKFWLFFDVDHWYKARVHKTVTGYRVCQHTDSLDPAHKACVFVCVCVCVCACVSVCICVWELLPNREHGWTTFTMHQERTGNFGTFLWAEGVKGAEIYTCLCAQYWEVLCSRDVSTSG